MRYNAMNDYELLYMIHQKDETAINYLIQKYNCEIKKVIKGFMRLHYRYMDHDDFYQMALLKLLDSILEYRQGTSSFHYFYFNALHNMFIDVIRRLNSNHAKNELYALSLDMQIEDQNGTYCLMDTIEDKSYQIMERQEILYQNLQHLKLNLKPLEREIIQLRSIGYTYQQIADNLCITKKKVDNTLHKVRKQQK